MLAVEPAMIEVEPFGATAISQALRIPFALTSAARTVPLLGRHEAAGARSGRIFALFEIAAVLPFGLSEQRVSAFFLR